MLVPPSAIRRMGFGITGVTVKGVVFFDEPDAALEAATGPGPGIEVMNPHGNDMIELPAVECALQDMPWNRVSLIKDPFIILAQVNGIIGRIPEPDDCSFRAVGLGCLDEHLAF